MRNFKGDSKSDHPGEFKAYYGKVECFYKEEQFFHVVYEDGDIDDFNYIELMNYIQPVGSRKYETDEKSNGSGGCGGCGGISEAAKLAAKAITRAKICKEQNVKREERLKRRAYSAGQLHLTACDFSVIISPVG